MIKEDLELTHDDLVFHQKLGEGSFGIVYRGTWRDTDVAIKQVKVEALDGEALSEFQSETKIMQSLRHPNVVLFLGATNPQSKNFAPLLVMEWMAGGSLFDALHHEARRRAVHENQIAIDIGQGLFYLHSCHPLILHRDLKSQNVLVDDRALHAKVATPYRVNIIHRYSIY